MSYQDTLRDALDQGLPLAQALEFLRAAGASPVEAAQAVVATTGMAEMDARQAVRQSRAWNGPRSGARLPGATRERHGAIGQHGRSGRGAASVLPHLARQSQVSASARR